MALVILASGRVADVDERGRATLLTCTWLVQVPTASLYPDDGDWFPDSPADVWTHVECGLPTVAPDGDLDFTTCEAGHDRLAYGSPRQQAAERAMALIEEMAARDPRLAAELDAR